ETLGFFSNLFQALGLSKLIGRSAMLTHRNATTAPAAASRDGDGGLLRAFTLTRSPDIEHRKS
ncbi:MAG: hypothetical protein WA851_27170, partial [Xanthobacteraceae bacterium]